MGITQSEYDFLMSLEKVFKDLSTPIELGPPPIHWTRQINSLTSKDIFLIDFYHVPLLTFYFLMFLIAFPVSQLPG